MNPRTTISFIKKWLQYTLKKLYSNCYVFITPDKATKSVIPTTLYKYKTLWRVQPLLVNDLEANEETTSAAK
jgi:hypothetical protein